VPKLSGGRDEIPGYDFKNPPPRKPQWRKSYRRTTEAWEEQLEREREFGIDKIYELPNGKRKRPGQMSGEDIRNLARRMAQQDLEHAINDWNSPEVRARRQSRRGEAQ
jgi:hypothetical protein